MHKPASFFAAVFLWIVAAAHVVRLALQISVTVGSVQLPLWLSIVPVIVLPVIALLLQRETRKK